MITDTVTSEHVRQLNNGWFTKTALYIKYPSSAWPESFIGTRRFQSGNEHLEEPGAGKRTVLAAAAAAAACGCTELPLQILNY